MDTMRKEDYLELGQIYAMEGKLEAALKSLRIALFMYIEEGQLDKIDKQALEHLPAELLSYYGLCIALVENRVEEGIRFCQKAARKDILRPDFYLNLGKVYLQSDQKARALVTFKRGAAVTEKNTQLLQELKKFGIRKKPVLSFLSRSHFLNRYAGLLLGRLKKAQAQSNKKRNQRTTA